LSRILPDRGYDVGTGGGYDVGTGGGYDVCADGGFDVAARLMASFSFFPLFRDLLFFFVFDAEVDWRLSVS